MVYLSGLVCQSVIYASPSTRVGYTDSTFTVGSGGRRQGQVH